MTPLLSSDLAAQVGVQLHSAAVTLFIDPAALHPPFQLQVPPLPFLSESWQLSRIYQLTPSIAAEMLAAILFSAAGCKSLSSALGDQCQSNDMKEFLGWSFLRRTTFVDLGVVVMGLSCRRCILLNLVNISQPWAGMLLLFMWSASFSRDHLCVAQNLSQPGSGSSTLPPASFIFGDSLVDAGNNNYIGSLARANYGANGVDFPGGKATGRFCNGRTVADIVGQLLGLPFGPVYLDPAAKGRAILKGVNYASGGAGILDFTGYNFVNRIPLWRQISMFKNTTSQIMQILGPTAGAALIKNSIYSVTMGSNDYLNNYWVVGSPSPTFFTPQKFQNRIINTYRQQLTSLVNLGARKFILSNVGPLGCIPYRMTLESTVKGQCVQSDNTLVSNFNTALRSLVDEFNGRYPQTKFVLADSYNVVSQIINNPAAFGFATKDQACCGVPVGLYHGLTPCFPGVPFCKNRRYHLFWDPYHPTDAANVIIGQRFFSGTLADIYPMNVQQLAALKLQG